MYLLTAALGLLGAASAQSGLASERVGETIAAAVGDRAAAPLRLEALADLLRQQQELAGTLSGPGQFTVFAPSDQALGQLQSLDRCGAIELNDRLVNTLLNYHVVRGDTTGREQTAGRVTSRLGAPLTLVGDQVIDASGARANITQGAILASNGVIHIIDRVLWPYPAPSC